MQSSTGIEAPKIENPNKILDMKYNYFNLIKYLRQKAVL